MAKHPYKATNRKDYTKQMCWYLDREEKTRFFSLLAEWQSVVGSRDPQPRPDLLQLTQQNVLHHLVRQSLPTPVRDIFKATVSTVCTETTAFQLGRKPSMQKLPFHEVQTIYGLPNFTDDLRQYFLRDLGLYSTHDLPFKTVTTWSQMRVQLKDPQDTDTILNPTTVQAAPPKREDESTLPGRYNFVLLRRNTPVQGEISDQGDFGIQGKT